MQRGVLAVAAGAALLASLPACSWQRERVRPVESFDSINAVYSFRNVRSSPRGDEWSQIQEALVAGLAGETRTTMVQRAGAAQPTNPRTVGEITLRDYEVSIRLPSHVEALRVQRQLNALAARPSIATGDPMGYVSMGEQVTATYEYLTSYSIAGVRVVVEGQTLPGATVTLITPEGEDSFETESGEWERRVRMASGQRWIYGYATPRAGPTRWFRIDIAAGTTQPIASRATFDRLREASEAARLTDAGVR
ncbi:MAG: hypothetical protein H6809_03305 [Phycisphaeraceae bacterium]|nr:hypothetical protein [Phycisphaeraceae bacterium]